MPATVEQLITAVAPTAMQNLGRSRYQLTPVYRLAHGGYTCSLYDRDIPHYVSIAWSSQDNTGPATENQLVSFVTQLLTNAARQLDERLSRPRSQPATMRNLFSDDLFAHTRMESAPINATITWTFTATSAGPPTLASDANVVDVDFGD